MTLTVCCWMCHGLVFAAKSHAVIDNAFTHCLHTGQHISTIYESDRVIKVSSRKGDISTSRKYIINIKERFEQYHSVKRIGGKKCTEHRKKSRRFQFHFHKQARYCLPLKLTAHMQPYLEQDTPSNCMCLKEIPKIISGNNFPFHFMKTK